MKLQAAYLLQRIELILNEFREQKLYPKVGAELEFYLQSPDQEAIDNVIKKLSEKYQVDEEKGHNQYECIVEYSEDIIGLIDQLNLLKEEIGQIASEYEVVANFAAKVHANDYGSALHLHLSMHDEQGDNIFSTQSYNDNLPLQQAIAGILSLAMESVYLLCPNEQDYDRFTPNFMAPTTVSWGGNNRTTIVRIPDSKSEFRRIEYRLPAASSDPYLAVLILLLSVQHGLVGNLNPQVRIYGLAHDSQYQLLKLPSDLKQAKSVFENNKVLSNLIGNI